MVSVLATYIWNRGLINNSYNPALGWELGPGVIVTYTSDPVSIANFSEAQVTILGNVAHSCGHCCGFRPLIFRVFIFMLNLGTSIFSSISFYSFCNLYAWWREGTIHWEAPPFRENFVHRVASGNWRNQTYKTFAAVLFWIGGQLTVNRKLRSSLPKFFDNKFIGSDCYLWGQI